MFDRRLVQRHFDVAAAGFDRADFVHRVTRDGLVERLRPVLLDASSVLDLGAATGATGRALRKQYRRARIVAVDLSRGMLKELSGRRAWWSRPAAVQADAARLPFAGQVFDLVVSNQMLPWVAAPEAVFAEVARVLREGGVFAFASLGPDSLKELRAAWEKVDDSGAHVSSFPDMHDVGDALVRAGLRDPVLDVDRLTVSYEDPRKLFADLTAAGGRNALTARHRALTGKQRFADMIRALAGNGGRFSLELEFVYGHCWGTGRRSVPADHRVDATRIAIRRRPG